jgi:hypothetical protein
MRAGLAMSAPVHTFRDARLSSTPLRALNRAGRGLAALGIAVPALSVESIVAAAQRDAGEEDLGGDSYLEPLRRYLEAAREEAQLNTVGRLAVRRMLVSALANRIRLASWARAHPEVRREVVAQPWVVLGLPRTGTSLLSILLGLDPESRALMHWEGARPIPPPSLATAAEDPRIAQNAREIATLEPSGWRRRPTSPATVAGCSGATCRPPTRSTGWRSRRSRVRSPRAAGC